MRRITALHPIGTEQLLAINRYDTTTEERVLIRVYVCILKHLSSLPTTIKTKFSDLHFKLMHFSHYARCFVLNLS